MGINIRMQRTSLIIVAFQTNENEATPRKEDKITRGKVEDGTVEISWIVKDEGCTCPVLVIVDYFLCLVNFEWLNLVLSL